MSYSCTNKTVATVNVLALSVVDRGFNPLLCQTKDYKISIYLLTYWECSTNGAREKTGWQGCLFVCLMVFNTTFNNISVITCCKQEISIYISVIKDDSTNQIKVYWDGGWIWLCYSDDLTLALYLCSITGYGFVYI
jgi:hypothetical protein